MVIWKVSHSNTPDSLLNEPTRLSGLAVQKLSYFLKVTAVLVCVKYSKLPRRKALNNPCVTHSTEKCCSISPDFEKKI
jgi:hypothetical protein